MSDVDDDWIPPESPPPGSKRSPKKTGAGPGRKRKYDPCGNTECPLCKAKRYSVCHRNRKAAARKAAEEEIDRLVEEVEGASPALKKQAPPRVETGLDSDAAEARQRLDFSGAQALSDARQPPPPPPPRPREQALMQQIQALYGETGNLKM